MISTRSAAADRTTEEIVNLFVKVVVVSLILDPPGAWALMLILGILHHEASYGIPALGFWLCLVLIVLAGFVKSAIAPRVDKDD